MSVTRKVSVEGYRCERCGHVWVPRKFTGKVTGNTKKEQGFSTSKLIKQDLMLNALNFLKLKNSSLLIFYYRGG